MIGKLLYIILISFLVLPKMLISQKNDSLQKANFLTEDQINFELLNAAYEGDEKKVLKLLKLGANVNTRTNDGITPLMYSSQGAYLSIVKILIFNGADVNAIPNDRTTALISAAKSNHIEIVEHLMLNNASINAIDFSYRSAFWYAVAYNNFILSDMLIFNGANIEQKDSQGNTPLMVSVTNSDYDIIELLLSNGADVNNSDNEGFTSLMFASQIGELQLTQLLLNNGADILQKNKNGMDALSFAVKNNHIKVVQLLIDSGADVNMEINPFQTPLSIAKIYKNEEIIKLLKSSGAVTKSKFYIDKFIINLNSSLNTKDFMTGLEIGFAEEKTRLILLLGYHVRPWTRNILFEKEKNVFYQFWEHRSMITLSLLKSFSFHSFSENCNLGLDAQLKTAYSFGRYRGSVLKPKNKLLAVPGINFYYKKDFYKIYIGYEYLNFHTEPISPHRLNIGVGFYFNTTKYREKNKALISL